MQILFYLGSNLILQNSMSVTRNVSLPRHLGNENNEQTLNNHFNHHFLRALTNPDKIQEQTALK